MTNLQERYGIIFDADVQINDVTLADAEHIYQKTAQDLEAQADVLGKAAQEAGLSAGTRMGAGLREQLLKQLSAFLPSQLASTLDVAVGKAMQRVSLDELEFKAELDTEKLTQELTHTLETVGSEAGATLGTRLAKAVSASLNRSIGQVARHLEEKQLTLKGKLALDKDELLGLQERGVDVPVHLKLRDAITKQASEDVTVTLRARNFDSIKQKLRELTADIQLTEGARQAIEQLNALPKHHTLTLYVEGQRDLEKVLSGLQALTSVQVDTRSVDFRGLEQKAAEAGSRAAVRAASAFSRTWRRVMREMDLKLDVHARIASVQAPANTPTIGVKAQTQETARTAARETVQEVRREQQAKPRPQAPTSSATAQEPAPVVVPAGENPARAPWPVQQRRRAAASPYSPLTSEQFASRAVMDRTYSLKPGFTRAAAPMARPLPETVVRKRQENLNERVLSRQLQRLTRQSQVVERNDAGDPEVRYSPEMMQLFGEVLEGYTRQRNAGVDSGAISTLRVSEDAARSVQILAAAHGIKNFKLPTRPRRELGRAVLDAAGKPVMEHYLPTPVAERLVGPRLSGVNMGSLEMFYASGGNPGKFYLSADNTQRNIVERGMLSGAVSSRLRDIRTPHDFARVYREEFKTDNYVERRNDDGSVTHAPAFAGPVYDWRFMQMAAATGYVSPKHIREYRSAMQYAGRLTDAEERARHEGSALGIIRAPFQQFLQEQLGMHGQTAEEYARHVRADRAGRAVERFTRTVNGQTVLLPEQERLDILLRSSLRGELTHLDAAAFGGRFPSPVSYEEQNMHGALSRVGQYRARTFPLWQKLARAETRGVPMLLTEQDSKQVATHTANVRALQGHAQMLLDAPQEFLKVAQAVLDADPIEARRAEKAVTLRRDFELLQGLDGMDLETATNTVRAVADRLAGHRRAARNYLAKNPNWNPSKASTRALLFQKHSRIDELAGLPDFAPDLGAVLGALEAGGTQVRRDMGVGALAALDPHEAATGATRTDMLLELARSQARLAELGDSTTPDALREKQRLNRRVQELRGTRIVRIKDGLRREDSQGKVSFEDDYVTLGELLQAQQEQHLWYSGTFLEQNTRTALGIDKRVRGNKYMRLDTATPGLTLGGIMRQSPALAGRLRGILPSSEQTDGVLRAWDRELAQYGLTGGSATDRRLDAIHRAEAEQQRLTAEEFRAYQSSVLATRYEGVASLFETDPHGRPVLVGQDYQGPKMYAPVGLKGAYFKLKADKGLLSQRQTQAGRRARAALSAGGGTLHGTLDALITERLNNMGLVAHLGDGALSRSRAVRYEIPEGATVHDAQRGTRNGQPFDYNQHLQSDSLEDPRYADVQDLLDMRDRLRTDPLGGALAMLREAEQVAVEQGQHHRVRQIQTYRNQLTTGGEAVNPFKLMGFVPLKGSGRPMVDLLANTSNPLFQNALHQDGADAGHESEQLRRLGYMGLQVVAPNGEVRTVALGMNGNSVEEEDALRVLAAVGTSTQKRGGALNPYREMARRAEAQRNALAGKGLTDADARKFSQYVTVLDDLGGMGEDDLGSAKGLALKNQFAALNKDLAPLLGSGFAHRAGMYGGKGGLSRASGFTDADEKHLRTLLSQGRGKATGDAVQNLRRLFELEELLPRVQKAAQAAPKDSPEKARLAALTQTVEGRIRRLQGHVSGLGVEPGITPVGEANFTDADVDDAVRRLTFGQTKKVDELPREVAPRRARAASSVRRVRVGASSPLNIGELLREQAPDAFWPAAATHSARQAVRGPLTGAAAEQVVRDTVGDEHAVAEVKTQAQAHVDTVRAAGGTEPITIKAGLKVDLSQFEAQLKGTLVSIGQIADATQRKLQQVLNKVAGMTGNAGTPPGQRPHAAAEGEDEPGLFRADTPYKFDNKLNRDVLERIVNDLADGKLDPADLPALVMGHLSNARAGYTGSYAQAGSVASVAGDRLREDERMRAVRVLGPAGVTSRDFFRFAAEPAKQRTAYLLAQFAKQEGLPLQALVRSVTPSIRNVAQFDPAYVRSLIQNPEFIAQVKAGNTAQAAQVLRDTMNGGRATREVLKDGFNALPGVNPSQFEASYKLFGQEFLQTALNPQAAQTLQGPARKILLDYLSGALDLNSAKRASQELLRGFNSPKSHGTRFQDRFNETENLTRMSFFEQVFAQTATRKSGAYQNLTDRQALEKFQTENPTLAYTVGEQLDRLRAYHGTMGLGNKKALGEGVEGLIDAQNKVRAGTLDDQELQAQAVGFENQVKALRDAERLRGQFVSYLRNPNMTLDSDTRTNAAKRLEMERMRKLASRADLRAIESGDTDVMNKLSDRARHVGERIKMLQNGIVNMAAFAASSLIQAAVTGVVQGLVEEQAGVRAVRAAINMQGGGVQDMDTIRAQGRAVSQALGVNTGEALTLMAGMGGDDPVKMRRDLVKLRGILNATGETTQDLGTFLQGAQGVGFQDPASIAQFVVSRGVTLKQAETARALVEDGLKNFGSDRDRAQALVGATEVANLKDWKLSDSTLVRERQMERLRQYGAEKGEKAQTSLPLDWLQRLSQQAAATMQSLEKALEPLIDMLGALAMGVLKVVKFGADVINLTGPIGKTVLALGLLATALRAVAASSAAATAMSWLKDGGSLLKGGFGDLLGLFGKVKNAPVVQKALTSLGGTAVGQVVTGTAGGLLAKGGTLVNNAKLLVGGALSSWLPGVVGASAAGMSWSTRLGNLGLNAVKHGSTLGIHAINGLQAAGRFIAPLLGQAGTLGAGAVTGGAALGANVLRALPWLGRAAGVMGGIASGPVGWAMLAGTALYEGYNYLKNRRQAEAEKVTSMSASGVSEGESLQELAAAYSGDLSPAMEAAGWSVEEVRKRIDKMAKDGTGRTRELAQEVRALAREYQLAGEFAKSLSTNLQTRIPAKVQEFKDRGIITFVGKTKNMEQLQKTLGGMASDERVYRDMQSYYRADWKAMDDQFFKGIRGFFAGKESRNLFGRIFNIRSAREAYKDNADLRALHNAEDQYARSLGAQADAAEGIRAQSKDLGIDKLPGFWRMMYNRWDKRGEGTGFGAWAARQGAGFLNIFGGYGRSEITDTTVSALDFQGTDKQFDQWATIAGIEMGRVESLAAVRKQFEKEGLGDFTEKSLERLRKNPKAYAEAMQALSQVNQQESEAWKGFYEGNIQDAVLKATAPGVIAQKALNAQGQGQFTGTFYGAISRPEQYAETMLYNQPGLKLRQAEAQRQAQLENLSLMGQELEGMERTGLVTNIERLNGEIVGFSVDTSKLKDVSSNTRQRLNELQERVAQAGGALGELALQIRQLKIEEVIKEAAGTQNLQSFSSGDVTLGGVLSGTQSFVSDSANPIDSFIGGLQNANMTTSRVGAGTGTVSGPMTLAQVGEAMRQRLGAANTYQLPNEDKTGFYGGKGHPGFDFNMSTNHGGIKSLTGGKVVFVGVDPKNPGYGNRVLVDSGNGYVHAYSHLSAMNVRVGDTVTEGQILGLQGGGKDQDARTRGASTGYHLDYSLYQSDGQGGYTGKALRDANSFVQSGAVSGTVTTATNRKLDQALQDLRESKEVQEVGAFLQNMPNRVAALKARGLSQGQLAQELNKLLAEGYVKVNAVNGRIRAAYQSADAEMPANAVLDGRQLLAGVMVASGIDKEFDQLVQSGQASSQVRNLMNSAQRKAAAQQVRQSGDGTLYGNAQATRTADAMDARDQANSTFVDAVSSATTTARQAMLRRGIPDSPHFWQTKQTADGFEYQTLTDEGLRQLTANESEDYQRRVRTALTSRTTALGASAFQTRVSEGQTRMQGMEQLISLELSRTPRTEVEKVQYQINRWNAFLKNNPNLDPQTKQAVRQKLSALGQQLREATRTRSRNTALQGVTNAEGANSILGAQAANAAGDLAASGDGTIAGNARVARDSQFQQSLAQAEQSFASAMNSAATEFLNPYVNDPENAYEVRKTSLGYEYRVLKQGYVNPESGKARAYRQRQSAAQAQLSTARESAERTRDRAAGQTYVQLAERELAANLAGKPMSNVERLQETLTFWKGKLNGSLDQYAEEAVRTKIEDIQNQLKDANLQRDRALADLKLDVDRTVRETRGIGFVDYSSRLRQLALSKQQDPNLTAADLKAYGISRDPNSPFIKGGKLEKLFLAYKGLETTVNAESAGFAQYDSRVKVGQMMRTGITGVVKPGQADALMKRMQDEARKLAPNFSEYGERAYDMALSQVMQTPLGQQWQQKFENERAVRESALRVGGVTQNLSRLLGGKLNGTTFQMQAFQTQRDLDELKKVQDIRTNPALQAAQRQANLLSRLSPLMDEVNDLAEQGKLDSVGQVGWEAFNTQDQGLREAVKLAQERGLDPTVLNRMLGEQITQMDQQRRQYEQAGKAAASRMATEAETLRLLQAQGSVVRTLSNGSYAEVLQARVSRDMELNSSRSTYNQSVLDITNERDNKTYSLDSLRLLADELGVKYDPKTTYADLNVRVAQARKSQALQTKTAQDTVTNQNFQNASLTRLASLVSQPLAQFETLADRVTAVQASSSDVKDEKLKAPLAAQLANFQVDPKSFGAFDAALTQVRDRAASGQVLDDAAVAGLFAQAGTLNTGLARAVLPTLTPLLEQTQAAVDARFARATNKGLTIGDEQDLVEADLKTLAQAFGGVAGADLKTAAEQAVRTNSGLAQQGIQVLGLLRQQEKNAARLAELQRVTQPIENAQRDVADAERTQGREAGLVARRAAITDLTGEFGRLSLGQSVEAVLDMDQETLNKTYGDQASAVKALAGTLRQLGIEVKQTTDLIDAENRARDVQQAGLALSRTVERGGDSASIWASLTQGRADQERVLGGMLKDPAQLGTALELVRKGDKVGLSKLLGNENQLGEFTGYAQGLDSFLRQGAGSFLTASVREQTQAQADALSGQFRLDGSVGTAVQAVTQLMTGGNAAAFETLTRVLGNDPERGFARNPDGSFTLDGKQYRSQNDLAASLAQDTTSAGEAARFFLGGAGASTAAGTFLSQLAPGVQSLIETKLAAGDFEGARQALSPLYAMLAQLLNSLLEQAGVKFRFDGDPANLGTQLGQLSVQKVGATPAQAAVMDFVSGTAQGLVLNPDQNIREQQAQASIARIERQYAANQPLWRSERAMLGFEKRRLAETNATLVQGGTIKFGADGQPVGPEKMVQVYQQNLRRMREITEDEGALLLKQWNDLVSEMMNEVAGAVKEGLGLVVGELLTGSYYRDKVAELDRNYGNQVTNAQGTLETYESRKQEAATRMDKASRQYGVGSREYLEAKADYEFYAQKTLEIRDNVRAINTEWEQQKFELKTISEMLLDLFDKLANAIINKTIDRFVDWGLDFVFGGSGGGGGTGGGLLGGLLGLGSQVVTGGTVTAASTTPATGSAAPVPYLTGQTVQATVPAQQNLFGVQGLNNTAIGGGMTSFGAAQQSGNPLVGVGLGAAQMALVGGMGAVTATGSAATLATFGTGAMAALSNPIGWAALAIGATVGTLVSIAKDRKETARREHIAEFQGLTHYGLKDGMQIHRAPGATPVNVNMQVASLSEFGTSRQLARKVETEARMKTITSGMMGVN